MSTEEEKKAKEQPEPEKSKHEPEQGDFAAGERTSDVDETGSDFRGWRAHQRRRRDWVGFRGRPAHGAR